VETETLYRNQLLATKFFVPSSPNIVIARPRLFQLLQTGLAYRLLLLSAPAGFGKSTLLSAWIHSLPQGKPHVAWISLDAEDNDPLRFWSYVLTALDHQLPGRFTDLLLSLQGQPPPPLANIVIAMINTLLSTQEEIALVLDDYHLLMEPEIHTSLAMFIEHLPAHLHLILATRTDPPLPLSRLRGRGYLYEVRTDELRCTQEEVVAFLERVMGIVLTGEDAQNVMLRTEGWLAGLQLFGLSLQQGNADPEELLDQLSGNQRYIFDYLTDEVLGQQDQSVQTFLAQTSILEQLNASLCDAVTLRDDSQLLLKQLEQANLFVISLDTKRQWYRYHHLFAETLRRRLGQTQPELIATLHRRASHWYAEHDFLTEAIQHAFSAHEWAWAAQLISDLPLPVIWRTESQTLFLLRHWLEALPDEIVYAQPHLCLAFAQAMYQIAPSARLDNWLDTAEATLNASLEQLPAESASEEREKQLRLLGEVLAYRAFLQSFREDGQLALPLCQRALALLSPDDFVIRAQIAFAQLLTYVYSEANDIELAIHYGQQAGQLALAADKPALAVFYLGATVFYFVEAGRLHEAGHLAQQVQELAIQADGSLLPEISMGLTAYADVLREWNQLDAALEMGLQAMSLLEQTRAFAPLRLGSAMLAHIYLSRGELDKAHMAFQEFDAIGEKANLHLALHTRSMTATVDQVRLWLTEGNLDRAIQWAAQLERGLRPGTAFAHEREEVALARVLLARQQPALALARLEPVLAHATAGGRRGHVMEIWLLQALAYHLLHEEEQALAVLALAVHQGEPEAYIRAFVDEGPMLADLLARLRTREQREGPTPYLDLLLDTFPTKSKSARLRPRSGELVAAGKRTPSQPLLDPLSERELDVLYELVQGASNQDIAGRLTISVETVKRHLTNIFSKMGVKSRVQAVSRARALGLISDDS